MANIGGAPTTIPDTPITALLIAFFVVTTFLYVASLAVQIHNHQRWAMAAMISLFACERIPTCALRIVLAVTEAKDVELAVASYILLQAGGVLLYITNLVYVGAVIRAGTGRHAWLPVLQGSLYIAAATALVVDATSAVLDIYTIDTRTRDNCRQVQRAANTFFAALATLPLGLLVLAYFGHRKRLFRVIEHTWFDAAITALAALLCMFASGFRAGVLWAPQRDRKDPAWYHSKSAFYLLELLPEILLLVLYMLVRVERRFHALSIPEDGAATAARRSSIATPPSPVPGVANATKKHPAFRERKVTEMPPMIPEICYSAPI